MTGVHVSVTMPKSTHKGRPPVTSDAVDAGKTNPLRAHERRLVEKGFQTVVGTDEAGRGPLAGPVVAGACHVPLELDDDPVAQPWVARIADSKTLTEEDREEIFDQMCADKRVVWAAHAVTAAEIDKVNILQASMLAMHESVAKICNKGVLVDAVLVDGPRLPWFHEEAVRPNGTVRAADPDCPAGIKHCEPIVKGDAKVFAIAAASVVAKVTRDRLMREHDKKWPEYGFTQHKGYPTGDHIAAIRKHGPCKIHRRTFAPLKNMNLQDSSTKKEITQKANLLKEAKGKKSTLTSQKSIKAKQDSNSRAGKKASKAKPMPKASTSRYPLRSKK